jgi:proliferating cell nuclear antigen PCNA
MLMSRLVHNAAQLKTVFDVLKDLVTDVNFVFKSDGLWINAMDPGKVVAVHLRIDQAAEYHHAVSDPIFIGVNVQNFYKMIRGANHTHTIKMEVESSTLNVLKLTISHLTKEIVALTSLYSLDLPKEEVTFPELSYEAVAIMPTIDFVRTIKDLSHGSNYITISASEEAPRHLSFTTKGDAYLYTTSIAICPSDGGLSWKSFGTPYVSGKHIIKYISKFAKSQTGKIIEISMNGQGMLNLSYPDLPIGGFHMTIAPMSDN